MLSDVFSDLAAKEHLGKVMGERVAEQLHVKVRGCEKINFAAASGLTTPARVSLVMMLSFGARHISQPSQRATA